MGLFDNLFKEKINWNENELKALLAILTAQASIDGNIDDDEANFITNCMIKLPGFKPADWKEFQASVGNIPADTHYNTLRNMHIDKRKVLVATVGLIAKVDGNLDDDEAKFFMGLANLMNVKLKK